MSALSLYGRTVGLVGVVIILACVVLWTTRAAIDTLAERHRALRLESTLLRAHAHATGFIMSGDPGLAVATEDALTESALLLSRLDPKTADMLARPINAYAETFDTLRTVLERRGVSDLSGAEGRLRKSILDLERRVLATESDRMLVHLLTARRSEKDFVLRGAPIHVRRVHQATDSLLATAERARWAASVKADLEQAVLAYRQDFDVAAGLADELVTLRVRLPYEQQEVGRLTGAVVQQVEEKARWYQQAAVATTLFAALLGLSLAYGLARGVVTPLTHLTHAARRIVAGDTDVDLDVEGSVEIMDLRRAISAVSRHVRERERAEDALRTSQQFVETVLGSVQDAVVVLDPAFRYLVVNRKFEMLMGLPSEALIGRAAVEIFPATEAGEMQKLFRRALDGDVVHSTDVYVASPTSGTTGWYVGTYGPLYDGDGHLVGVVGTLHDVTERKASEFELVAAKEAAEELAQMKSTFLNNMSHEIRTPLTAIIGFAQIMRQELDGETEELASIIQESGQRLLNTLNDVLDLARLEADSTPDRVQPVDAAPATAAVVDLYRPLALKKGLDLRTTFDPPDTPHTAFVEPGSLERILSNLLSNAIKFTERGYIHVAVGAADAFTTVAVSDTGCGIEPSFRPHLFQEFRQQSSGLNRSHEGSGLGLALTKRLVERLGGRIEVETTVGAGSCFTVFLPSSAPRVSRHAATSSRERASVN